MKKLHIGSNYEPKRNDIGMCASGFPIPSLRCDSNIKQDYGSANAELANRLIANWRKRRGKI